MTPATSHESAIARLSPDAAQFLKFGVVGVVGFTVDAVARHLLIDLVRDDRECRKFMTAPGVGPRGGADPRPPLALP